MVKPKRTPASKRMPVFSRKDLKTRAARISVVLTDSDGVLTDTGVYYAETGEAFKRFSIRDGMGAELLRNAGIETIIVTGETSGSVRRRAEKLQMKHLYLGIKDKRAHLPIILQETGRTVDQVAYIGDDVNDLGIIQALQREGITAAPSDALPAVAAAVHFVCTHRGGHGAFREFADWLLALRSPVTRLGRHQAKQR